MTITLEQKKDCLIGKQPALEKPDGSSIITKHSSMKSITEFTPSKDFTLLLMGEPGSGKTTTALQLVPVGKKVLVIDCDRNLSPAVRFLTSNRPDLIPFVSFYQPEVTEVGQVALPDYKLFDAVFKQAIEASKDPEVGTIIVDSATVLNEWCIKKILKEQPTKTGNMEKQSWGSFYNAMFNFMSGIKNAGKWFILVSHQTYLEDDMTKIMKYVPNIPGKSAVIIPGLFSDFWRLEIESSGDKRIVKVKTAPGPRCTLRCSLDMKDGQVFNHTETVDKIQNFTTKGT